MTTFMIAWHRTMRTPATTSTEHRAHSLSQCSLVFIRTHMHRGSSSKKFAPFTPSPCAWSSVRSLHLDLPFLFPALPSAPLPLPQVPAVCGKPAQLLQREYGLR